MKRQSLPEDGGTGCQTFQTEIEGEERRYFTPPLHYKKMFRYLKKQQALLQKHEALDKSNKENDRRR